MPSRPEVYTVARRWRSTLCRLYDRWNRFTSWSCRYIRQCRSCYRKLRCWYLDTASFGNGDIGTAVEFFLCTTSDARFTITFSPPTVSCKIKNYIVWIERVVSPLNKTPVLLYGCRSLPANADYYQLDITSMGGVLCLIQFLWWGTANIPETFSK